MAGDVDILHHVGLVTADMDGLIRQYERLGFAFTPLSMPRIVLHPGGEPELLGAGNRHAIFRDNYLEVLAVIDRARWDRITRAQRGSFDIDVPLARYQGLHVLHFGADDIDAVHRRLIAAGIPCADVAQFQRNVDTPSGPQTMRAKYVSFPGGGDLPSLTQIAQHLTPELVLQPRYMGHRNGALSVTETIICATAPQELAARYARYAGRTVAVTGHLSIVELGRSRLVLVDPAHLEAVIPGATPPMVPYLAGFTVATADLDRPRAVLRDAGVPAHEQGGRLIVSAEHAYGSAVLFETERAVRS
jgi:catechol 2,3-dioxygenase-like lactoylglutathione lyase family enzyme